MTRVEIQHGFMELNEAQRGSMRFNNDVVVYASLSITEWRRLIGRLISHQKKGEGEKRRLQLASPLMHFLSNLNYTPAVFPIQTNLMD